MKSRIVLLLASLLLAGCLGMPEQLEPVSGFEAKKYLGTWYEIARLDHRFERGMSNVTARYELREDGGLTVVNRGFVAERGEWSEATGKAYLVGDESIGHLKVSFFGPFYASYVIFGLDQEDYQYAFVSGPDHSYLWLLSRQPEPDQAVVERFLEQARQAGFATDELIFVAHDRPQP